MRWWTRRSRSWVSNTRAVESAIVDVVEEPVPGVVSVTEIEETEVREPNVGPAQPEQDQDSIRVSTAAFTGVGRAKS